MPNGGFGAAPLNQAAAPQMPPAQQGMPQPPRQFPEPVARRTSPLLAIGVILAIALGAAALIVSLTSVGKQPTQPGEASTSTPTTQAASGDTTEADRALCQAIAPLIKESIQDGKDFVNIGFSGTPERDGGIPAYKAKVDALVGRIQGARRSMEPPAVSHKNDAAVHRLHPELCREHPPWARDRF